MKTKIQIRRDTAANWASNNPILSAGEFGLESDTQKIKVGNGSANWAARPYINVLPSELTELSQDAVNSALTAGNGITKVYDDLNNTITISVDTSIIANKDYVDDAISGVLDGAPGLLDTLKELAAAIDDDPAFFTSVATNLSNHEADTTSIHGIADTAELATKTFAAELLTNSTKSNITITGDKNGLTITAENGVADSTTSDLAEGTNLYFTDERAQDAVGNSVGLGLTYDDPNGVISFDPYAIRLNQFNTPDRAVSFNNNKITNLATPTDETDAATKAYVDSAAQGIDWKASVRVATTVGSPELLTYANGTVVDGVTLSTGDRILIKNQATGSENGIYVVKESGAPDRSTDADIGAELTSNFAVFVEEGTENADQGYVLTNDGTVTVGTTALTFTQFTGLGQIIAGTGLDKTGNTLDIDSTVVTLTDTQSLSNKTLTSPVINGATVGGDLVPSTDATYDLGSPENKFKDLYLSGATLYLDTATIELHSGNIQLSHSGNTTIVPIGNGNHTVATLDGQETLSNKPLTSPTINGPEITATGGTPRIHGIYLPEPHFITFEGSTNNEFETVLNVINPTADRTINLPDHSGTIALTSDIAELSQDAINDAIVAGVGLDKTYDDLGNTITLDIDSTVVTLNDSQTLTNKTISFANGYISSAAGYDNIVGFYGQNNIPIIQAGLDKGGKINISNEGIITIPFSGNGYTTGVATIGGGTRIIITVSGNTITGTINEFNNALTDADFATISGVESLTNKTLTSPKINEDVVLSATSSELNILDGATLSTTELNYVDGVTSSVQDQIDDKAPINSPSFTGNVELPSTTVFGSNTAASSGKYLRTDGTNVSWAYPVIPYGSGGSASPLNGQLFFNTDTLSLQIWIDGQWLVMSSMTIDGGNPFITSFTNTFDGGTPSQEPSITIDGGSVNSFPAPASSIPIDGGSL
jgi:hypothetical protein